MSLQVSAREANILLKKKNELDPEVLAKYEAAGQITQTCMEYLVGLINDSYHYGKHQPYTAAELCLMGDSCMQLAINKWSIPGIKEKGIAQPVTIDVNDLVEGYSPEFDDKSNFTFEVGDIVTLNCGCHIDGYTSRLAHTVVIYPPGAKPAGPLLGSRADAICATHIASEAITSLLGCSLTPEKLPRSVVPVGQTNVTGSLIREIVDSIAQSFHCVVVPGSKVRRIRRFLAGQAEGVVAERDFKGVVWSESDQERFLLEKSGKFVGDEGKQILLFKGDGSNGLNDAGTVPTDDFIVTPGEVYTIDIRMAPLADQKDAGLVTLEVLDQYSGKNNAKDQLNPKPSVFVRDVSVTYQLKLKTARKLLTRIDNTHPVYPFKLSELSYSFPLDSNKSDSLVDQVTAIHDDMKPDRLGMSEITNERLAIAKPIWAARFIPLQRILRGTSATGLKGYDASNPTLPGLELPLPRLGITSLQLKTMLKHSSKVSVAREMSTVVLDNTTNTLLRLSGGQTTAKASWVHSKFGLQGDVERGVEDLVQLLQDSRFGVQIKECKPVV